MGTVSKLGLRWEERESKGTNLGIIFFKNGWYLLNFDIEE